MAGSLGPEMLTSARLPLSGVDLPRMLRPKSVIIELTHYQCAGFTLAQGRAEMRGSHNLAVADTVGPPAVLEDAPKERIPAIHFTTDGSSYEGHE